MFFGRYAVPGNDVQVRFFKKRIACGFQTGSTPFQNPKLGRGSIPCSSQEVEDPSLQCSLLLPQLIDKMNRYTTTEAEQMLHEGKQAAAHGGCCYSHRFFFLRGYIFNQEVGGTVGAAFTGLVLMAFYRLTHERQSISSYSSVARFQRGEAPYSRESTELLHDANYSVRGNSLYRRS